MKNTIKQNSGNIAKNAYEASVKARALARAGHCNNINGHILEIMDCDKTNLNPINIAKGIHETLTKSPTATTVDAVVTKGGKIIQRIQYKDTAKSIGDTVRRVKSGQYHTTTLKGTTETAKVFNKYAEKHGISQRMQDTGISSKTTKSLARSCGGARQLPLGTAVKYAARSGAMAGGVAAGGISLVTNTIDVLKGEKEFGEAAGEVVKDTAGGALSGAGAGAAATATGAGVAAGLTALGVTGTVATVCTVAAPLAVAIGVGCAISTIWNKIWD